MPQREQSQTLPRAPLWRRALALLIDWAVAWVVFALLIQPFIGQGVLRLPTPVVGLSVETCTDLDTPPDWLTTLVQGQPISHQRLCEQRLFGIPNGRTLVAILSEETGTDGALRRQFVSIPVDADLRPAGLYDISGLLLVMLLGLGSAALTAMGQQTPGRRVMGLVLSGPRRRAWAREGLRLAPLVLLLALPLVMPFRTLAALPVPAVVTLVAACVAGWIGWVGLRFFTHGAAPRHDSMTGFAVTKGH